MIRKTPFRVSATLGAVILISSGHAQGADSMNDAPSDRAVMLPCDGKCATITQPLKRLSGASLPDISQFAKGDRYNPSDKYSEAYVELQYTIQPDGTVADDVAVTKLLGPQEYADAAKRTVRTFKYAPAMVDGAPVAISHRFRAVFGVSDVTGARSSVTKGYNDASELLKSGKTDEARSQLMEMLKTPKLNFYERSVIMYPLALIAMQRQEFEKAKQLAGMAFTLPGGLPPSLLIALIRIYIRAALFQGDIAGAGKVLDDYSKASFYDKTDPVIKEVADARNKFDALPSYAATASIPEASDGDGFEMDLYRRYFTFTKIVGKLNLLTVSCKERAAVSPISEKAEWSVPKNWSDCSIFVKGTPGTTFQVVQFASPPPSSQEMQPR
ncbi:MAG: energy transducer TonB [Alphaproteobacteria bacterium]|nr:energy transducer TonB [Alphaproteobacteria bacterium]